MSVQLGRLDQAHDCRSSLACTQAAREHPVGAPDRAGAHGIVLFTVQHSFEHSYASADEGWDRDEAALLGTRFLILPRWLNWLTADAAYHHLHHLCASVPNYRLAACHKEHEPLFEGVRRVGLLEIPAALKHILWDMSARRLVSVTEVMQRGAA